MSSQKGIGSSKTLCFNENEDKINDPYDLAQDTASIKRKIQEDSDDENADADGYLNIYDESKDKKGGDQNENTKLDKVKLTADDETDQENDIKPMIKEMNS